MTNIQRIPLVDLSEVSPREVPDFILQLRTLRTIVFCDRGTLLPHVVYPLIYYRVHECLTCSALPQLTPQVDRWRRAFDSFVVPGNLPEARADDAFEMVRWAELDALDCWNALMDFAEEFFFDFCNAYFYTSPDDPTLILLSLDTPEDFDESED